MKSLIMQFSPTTRYSLPLRPKYFFSTLFSNARNARDQVSYPYKTTDKSIVLYILIFTFVENRWEDKKILFSRVLTTVYCNLDD